MRLLDVVIVFDDEGYVGRECTMQRDAPIEDGDRGHFFW